jgi:hypothetical protein
LKDISNIHPKHSKGNKVEFYENYVKMFSSSDTNNYVLLDIPDYDKIKHFTWREESKVFSSQVVFEGKKTKFRLNDVLFDKEDPRYYGKKLVNYRDLRSGSLRNIVNDYGDYIGITPNNFPNDEFLVDKEIFVKYLKNNRCYGHHSKGKVFLRVHLNNQTPYVKRIILDHYNVTGDFSVTNVNDREKGIHDYRIKNLLVADHTKINATQKPKGKVKYKGVYFNKQRNKYQARVTFKGKAFHCGFHDDPKEAAKSYDTKAVELFGEDYAMTNKKMGLL